MCGIFTLLNNENSFSMEFIEKCFNYGKGRGPENSNIKNIMLQTIFGFHRLAINGLDDESNQPITYKNVSLICNGEIYNYKQLYDLLKTDVTMQTNSDCEIIIHLYIKFGIEHTLQLLDGVFSFVLLDASNFSGNYKLYTARDPYGIRPMYILKSKFKKNVKKIVYGFASELKQLAPICIELNKMNKKKTKHTIIYNVFQFSPGTYSEFLLPLEDDSYWKINKINHLYHKIGFYTPLHICNENIPSTIEYKHILRDIRVNLQNAVEKRCSTSDRPIACLLSGGLDSSLITSLVNDYHVNHNLPRLETYSIGIEYSEDLINARVVADHLNTIHTEIIISEKDILDTIPKVIHDIESYDTTTVRASIGNWLLGEYISKHSKAKVIFNGDGSDELMGGYLYISHASNCLEFDKECRQLLQNIYMFDVLRSDKCISSHGLEPRTPFLDRSFVQFYMSISPEIRFNTNGIYSKNKMEKYLLRSAFSDEIYIKNRIDEKPLLPESILWRRKEAFSDGVSKQSRSLYTIIQEFTDKYFEENVRPKFCNEDEPYENVSIYQHISNINENMHNSLDYLSPTTSEQYYYREIFEKHYPGFSRILPYFWMPKYVDAKDSSARTLSIYGNNSKEK